MEIYLRIKDSRLTIGIDPLGSVSVGYFREYSTYAVKVLGPVKLQPSDPARRFSIRKEWRLTFACYDERKGVIRPVFHVSREGKDLPKAAA